jgi:hypothetical protein
MSIKVVYLVEHANHAREVNVLQHFVGRALHVHFRAGVRERVLDLALNDRHLYGS